MVILKLTKEQALCLKNNIEFAINQLCDHHIIGGNKFDPPEIEEEIDILQNIIFQLDEDI